MGCERRMAEGVERFVKKVPNRLRGGLLRQRFPWMGQGLRCIPEMNDHLRRIIFHKKDESQPN